MADTDERSDTGGDWITANEAYRLVRERNGSYDVAVSIAIRANAGLLRSAASLFLQEVPCGGSRKETHEFRDVELPRTFWWATGHAAMEQNWNAGDFSTWIDKTYHWQAFGVKFELAGIEAMLAPPAQSAPEDTPEPSRPEVKRPMPTKRVGRPLTHDHPYAAAKAALELANLPEDERSRLNGPSVGKTMAGHYQKPEPHDDALDEYGARVLKALKEFWNKTS